MLLGAVACSSGASSDASGAADTPTGTDLLGEATGGDLGNPDDSAPPAPDGIAADADAPGAPDAAATDVLTTDASDDVAAHAEADASPAPLDADDDGPADVA
jgi:hypothetical protein